MILEFNFAETNQGLCATPQIDGVGYCNLRLSRGLKAPDVEYLALASPCFDWPRCLHVQAVTHPPERVEVAKWVQACFIRM